MPRVRDLASPKVMSLNFEDMAASLLVFVAVLRQDQEAFALKLIQSISRLLRDYILVLPGLAPQRRDDGAAARQPALVIGRQFLTQVIDLNDP